MSCCEKCWGDAYLRSLTTSKDQPDCYKDLLEERRDNPCSPREQAGQFWDEEQQCDRRLLKLQQKEEQKMKNADSHIYLYAKGWYKKTDLMQDLKQILGQRSGINPGVLSNYDVVRILLNVTWPHIVDSGNPKLTFMEFVTDLEERNYWKLGIPRESVYSFSNAVVGGCLSILARVRVLGDRGETILALDEADPEILPLSRKPNKEDKKCH